MIKIRKILIYLSVIAFIVLLYGVFKIATFNLFDDDTMMIKEVEVEDKNYGIKIYYIPSDATIQASIQVRKYIGSTEEVLEDYERYNFLERTEIKNDTLMIRVNDTSRNHVKAKNFYIKLPK